MIEELLLLKNGYIDCQDPSFHTGNLGTAFAFISLGSTLNSEGIYDFGLSLLSRILDNKSGLNSPELTFLGCVASFLETNELVELNSDFYDPIDEFLINYIQKISISDTDYNIFLALYYLSNRINNSPTYQQMQPQVMQSIVLIVCELIIKIDKIRMENPSKDYIKFLYCSHMVTSFFQKRGLFSEFDKRLKNSIELAIKHLVDGLSELTVSHSLLLKKLCTALKIPTYVEKIDFQNDEGISHKIQNLFIITTDNVSISNEYKNIYAALNYKNFGLLNSRLGLLLLKGMSRSKNSDDLTFFMQVYKNTRYDLPFRTTSRVLF